MQGLMLLVKKIKKELSSIKGSGITLKNDEMKDIMTVNRSLQTEKFYWKELLEKLVGKKDNFVIFLDH